MGTPLYKTLPSLTHLSKAKIFKQENPQFLSFINKTYKTKKEGFWCDKNKKSSDIAQRRAKYVKDLRTLIKEELKLEKLIVKKMNYIIDKKMPQTYRYFKRSNHEVFKTNKKLRNKMAKYDKQLKKTQTQEKKKNANKAKDKKKKANANLRTSKNLNGLWSAQTKKETYTLKLKGNTFSMSTDDGYYLFDSTGTYNAKNSNFTLAIVSVTQSKKGKNPHTRHASLTQSYKIKKISTTQLWIQRPHTDILKFTKK